MPYTTGHFSDVNLPPPQDEKKQKRMALRRSANLAGLYMLVLILSFELVFPLLIFLLGLFGVVTAEGVYQPYLGLGNTTYMLVYAAVYFLSMGAPLLLLLGKYRFNPFRPARRIHAGVGALGYLGAVGVCMLANVITSLILAALSEVGVEATPPPQLMENSIVSFSINLFVMAVLPALLEELVFRGCVLRLLRPYGEVFAVVISAVLFGLMHGNLRQIPFATIVGLVLGWLYVVTGNIWMPILVHFTNNAISVITEYLSFDLTENGSGLLFTTVLFRLIGIGVVAVALLLCCYWRWLKCKKALNGLSFWSRLFSLFTSWALVGSMALFILLMMLEMNL